MKGLKLLLWKNWKILCREKRATAFEILTPISVVFAFFLVRVGMKTTSVPEPTLYEPFEVGQIPDAVRFGASEIYYTPTNTLTDGIMDFVLQDQFLNRGLNYTIKGFSKENELLMAYEERAVEETSPDSRGPVLAGIVFERVKGKRLSSKIKYTLRFPSFSRTKYKTFRDRQNFPPSWLTTLSHLLLDMGPRAKGSRFGGFPGYFDEGFLYLQQALDGAIAKRLLSREEFGVFQGLTLQLQRFPLPPYTEDSYNFICQMWLPLLFGCSFIYSIMNTTRAIVHEKVTRVKEFMKIMGLPNWLHWLSWFFRSYSMILISCVGITIVFKLQAENASIFTRSNPLILFLVLAAYGLAVVTFAFMLSTFFNNEDTGATVAGFVWILSSFIFYSHFVALNTSSKLGLIWRCAGVPNVAIGFAIILVGKLEMESEGLQWENFWDKDYFCVADCALAMLGNSLVCFLVAIYMELAYPGEYGIRLPWYYPFTRWFWTGGQRERKVKPVLKSSQRGRGAFESDPPGAKAGVEFLGLTKVFGSKVAVNNLNFKMLNNQVTALLGHNGAGKTTVMSILTGLVRPSGGSARINSVNITTNMECIRESLGFCPQYNILFDNLSVEDHLRFYCKLKGCSESGTLDEIEGSLKFLGLEDKRHTLSKNLSGGMKRKLCVGMAFSARSKVVLLDEPTAGMDPEARRSTWDMIQEQKRDKTVILSTHYLEEADLLSDRIAIMAEGQLQCCGSPLFLKEEYGGTYTLVIVKDEGANSEAIQSVILHHFPTAAFNQVGAELSCKLPAEKRDLFPRIFDELEAKKDELGVGTYAVKCSSMEEVFMKVGELLAEDRKQSPYKSKPEAPSSGVTEAESYGNISSQHLYKPEVKRYENYQLMWVQLKAMLTKKILISTRNWSLVALQIVAPLAIMMFHNSMVKRYPTNMYPKPLRISFENFEHILPTTFPVSCAPTSKLCQAFKNVTGLDRNVLDVPDASVSEFVLQQMETSLLGVNRKYIIGIEESEGNGSIILTSVFNNHPIHTPPLAMNVLTNGLLDYFHLDHRVTVTNFPLPLLDTDLGFFESTFTTSFLLGMGVMISGAFLAPSFLIFPIRERICRSKHLQYIAGVPLPLFWLAEFIVDFLVGLIYSVGILLILIYYDELWEFKSVGMMLRYFALSLLYLWALIPFAMFWSNVLSVASSAYARLVVIFMFAASIPGFLVAIMSVPELEVEEWKGTTFNVALSVPQFAVATGIQYLIEHYNLRRSCEALNLTKLCAEEPTTPCCTHVQSSYFAWEASGIGKNMTSLGIFGSIFFILLICKECRLYQRLVVVLKGLRKPSSIFRNDMASWMVNPYSTTEMQDIDVVNENRRVTHSTLSSLTLTDNLIVRGLTKSYKGKFTAVDGLNFGVKQGEIFGLLGVNGAGKTTTFKMLTGGTGITSGDAFINSFSVKTHTRKAFSYLGYCPQFDACLEELTGRETLEMFGKIKGVPKESLGPLVEKLSANLLFTQFLDKQVVSYSGGNKRKLSTAVAMLGDPAIIFLDEPTAGMDPVARRHVWDAISLVRDMGASFVITSHNMEECEALCSKLAIMVRGQFKCLGSPQHLRSKLCPGYMLISQLAYDDSRDEDSEERNWEDCLEGFDLFLQNKFPGCLLKDFRTGFVQYSLPASNSWSHIFAAMEEAKGKFRISAYSVGQADLEQVFFNFTQ